MPISLIYQKAACLPISSVLFTILVGVNIQAYAIFMERDNVLLGLR